MNWAEPERAMVVAQQARLGQAQIAQPVAGIRGVGDELPQKDRFIAVKRVGDDVEQTAHLRLKAMTLRNHDPTLLQKASCPALIC
jgi:hypothetical protein